MQGNIESVLLALYRLMLFIEKKRIIEFAIVSCFNILVVQFL